MFEQTKNLIKLSSILFVVYMLLSIAMILDFDGQRCSLDSYESRRKTNWKLALKCSLLSSIIGLSLFCFTFYTIITCRLSYKYFFIVLPICITYTTYRSVDKYNEQYPRHL